MKYVAAGYSLNESPKGVVSYNCTETKAYIESTPMELAEAKKWAERNLDTKRGVNYIPIAYVQVKETR